MHKLYLLWAAHYEDVWLRRQKRNRSRRCLENINEMPDQLFMERFGLKKRTFESLCTILRAHTSLKGTVHIPLEVKVLCTLSFLATGSHQKIVGVSQHLPQRTASRCIRQVIDALNIDTIVNKWIKFPQTKEERSQISQEFKQKFNLPGVTGCIDCTHIAIVKPNENEHLYSNNKGYYSVKVQIICDSNLNILNVNAKYGGATRNSDIWSTSLMEPYMRDIHQSGETTWLLGDSSYPQKPWLRTPIENPAPGSQEDIFNTQHAQARNCIENCFSLLKAHWKCLQSTLHYHPYVATQIIHACCILHNTSLDARIPPPHNVIKEQCNDNDGEVK